MSFDKLSDTGTCVLCAEGEYLIWVEMDLNGPNPILKRSQNIF